MPVGIHWQRRRLSSANKFKVHIREALDPPAIICEVTKIAHGSLRSNEKVGQNRIVRWFPAVLTKGHSRPPSCIGIEWNRFKITQILIHCISRSASRGQFAVRDRADRQPIARGGPYYRRQAGIVLRVIPIQPGNNDRRVHENHGRVLRNNSSPEISPSHVPARARMCSTTASWTAGLERTYSSAAWRSTAVGFVLAARVFLRKSRARDFGSRMVSVSVIQQV